VGLRLLRLFIAEQIEIVRRSRGCAHLVSAVTPIESACMPAAESTADEPTQVRTRMSPRFGFVSFRPAAGQHTYVWGPSFDIYVYVAIR
jgi:hypothetical protein